jgi:hypothetical protein
MKMNSISKFTEFVMKNNPIIKDVLCHNFTYKNEDQFTSGQDNALFVLFLKKKMKWIKITQKIDGNVNGLRFKMYYASTPENEFKEEQSYELGFMDGEYYTYILKLSDYGSDALRFDFGFMPIDFQFQDFLISSPGISTIFLKNITNLLKSARAIFSFIGNNKVSIIRIMRKVKREGFVKAIRNARNTATNATKEANKDKTTIQVVEPYKIVIKNELLPNRKKVLHFIENFYTGGSSRLIIDIIEHYGHK